VVRGKVIFEQIHEPAEALYRPDIQGWLEQDFHKFVIQIGTTGVGLGQHLTNEAGSSHKTEQGLQYPALTNQAFDQRSAQPLPSRQAGEASLIEGALGTIDKHYLEGRVACTLEAIGCHQCHEGSN
jgi:hypothetical protein